MLRDSDFQPVIFSLTNYKRKPLAIDPKYLKLNLKMRNRIQTGSKYILKEEIYPLVACKEKWFSKSELMLASFKRYEM
jgi:hypothetical protein